MSFHQKKLFYCTGINPSLLLEKSPHPHKMHYNSADQYSCANFECNSRVTQLTEPSSFT